MVEALDHSALWDIAKFILSVIIIPFAVWIVTAHFKLKGEVADLKLKIAEDKSSASEKFAVKADVTALATQIDTKFTSMQNAVTQRIDTMQSNLAAMIAGIASKSKD